MNRKAFLAGVLATCMIPALATTPIFAEKNGADTPTVYGDTGPQGYGTRLFIRLVEENGNIVQEHFYNGDLYDEDENGYIDKEELEYFAAPLGYKLAEMKPLKVSDLLGKINNLVVKKSAQKDCKYIKIRMIDNYGNQIKGYNEICVPVDKDDYIDLYPMNNRSIPAGYRIDFKKMNKKYKAEDYKEKPLDLQLIPMHDVFRAKFVDQDNNQIKGFEQDLSIYEFDQDGMIDLNTVKVPGGYKMIDPQIVDIKKLGGKTLNIKLEKIFNPKFVRVKDMGKLDPDDTEEIPMSVYNNYIVDHPLRKSINYAELNVGENLTVKEKGIVDPKNYRNDNIGVHIIHVDGTQVITRYVDPLQDTVGVFYNDVDKDNDGVASYSELTLPEGYELNTDVLPQTYADDVSVTFNVADLAKNKDNVVKVFEKFHEPVEGKVFLQIYDEQGHMDGFALNVGGKLSEEIEEPVKEGYKFLGWNTKEDGTGETYTLDSTVTENLRLFAMYEKIGGEEPQPETPTERNIKISFVTEDKTNVGDAEVTLPVENGTTAKLSDLVAYVPKGYELASTGDLYIAPEADTVQVTVRKKAVVEPELPAKREVNVEFVTEDNKVVGNKKLTLSVENGTTAKLSDLEVYVPEGYELAQSGDLYIAFDADSVQVSVRKKAEEKPEAPQLPTTIDVTIQFLEDGKNIVSEQKVTLPVENGTIAHYADVEKYVPEGFEPSQSGDFYVDYKNPNSPVKIEVRRKAVTPEEPEEPQVPVTVDVELHFVEDGKDVVAKEKVTLPVENGTVAHYADVEKYVPAGYELCNAGDFYVDYKNPNEPVIIAVRRIPVTPEEPQKPEPQPEPEQPQVPTTVDVVLHFVDGEEIISKEKVTLPVQYGTVAKYADVEKYVPAGYELAQSGDFFVDPAEPNAPIEIQVRKVETEGPTEPQKPETPENKPEAPQKPEAPENKPEKPSAPSDDKKPAAKPEKHEGVNTGDFASLFAGISAVTAGSAAAVLAMRKKRRNH